MGEADEPVCNGVADDQGLLTDRGELNGHVPGRVTMPLYRPNSRHDLGAGLDPRPPVGDQFEDGLRARDHAAPAFREGALPVPIAPVIRLPVRNDIPDGWKDHS